MSAPWRGKTAELRVDRLAEDSAALRNVAQADDIWAAGEVYREPLRAQFHFSPGAAGTTTPTGSSTHKGSIIFISSIILTDGAGATCTGATP